MTDELESYEPPAFEDGDDYDPKENYGHLCIVIARELKHGVVTANSPDGGDALIYDVADITSGHIGLGAFTMSTAIVDGLKGTIGKSRVLVWEKRTSKAGRPYPGPAAATPEQVDQARAWLDANRDWATPKLDTINAEAPF